ncbi:MAG: nitrate/nitrite transporter NrtS [Gallionella sp.]
MRIVPLLRTAGRRRIAISALKVALVVGTLLNLVNQGGNQLDGLPLNTVQMLLNFLVPFCVSSYSAARNEMQRCDDGSDGL